MKIKTRMLLFIALPILMAILLIAGSSYVYSSRMVEGLSKSEMLETAKKYGSNLETFIAKQIANVDMLSDSITMSDLSDKELYNELIYVTDKNSEILAAFAGFSDKRFFNGSQLPVPDDYDPTTRDWYKDSMKSDHPYVSIPYTDAASGDTVITISTQIKKDGKAIGVLGLDITMKTVNELVNGIKLYDTGFAYIIDSEGYIVSYKDYEPSEEFGKIEDGSKADLVDTILEGDDETFYSVEDGVKRVNSKYGIIGTDWTLVVSVPESEVMGEVHNLSLFMIGIGAFFFVLILGLLLWIIKSITSPIAALGKDMEKLADYDFSEEVKSGISKNSGRKDEIGSISRGTEKVVERLRDIVLNIREVSGNILNVSDEIADNAKSTAKASDELTKAVDGISIGAMHQAEDMQRGTKAMQSMGEALRANEESMVELNNSSDGVYDAKEKGISAIKDLINTTAKVEESAMKVSEVIVRTDEGAKKIDEASTMIKSIAGQTNLLALNAAIEAARAGEAGKGFAVVADEIRKLAEQTDKFTEEIVVVVRNLSERTREAVDIMEEVKTVIGDQVNCVDETEKQFVYISDEIDVTKTIIGKLNNSEKELESARGELSEIVEGLAAVSEENAAATEECLASVEEQAASTSIIESSAERLPEMAKGLEEAVQKFKL